LIQDSWAPTAVDATIQRSAIPSKADMFGTLALAGISRDSSNARRRRRRKIAYISL
jgi:hypothetical protein